MSESPIRFTLAPVGDRLGRPGRPLQATFDMLEAADPDVIAAAAASKEHGSSEDVQGQYSEGDPYGQVMNDDMGGDTEETPTHKVPKERPRNFLLHASPWKGNLAHHIERTHYSGPFDIEHDSIGQRELEPVVPFKGLSMIDLKKPLVLMERVTSRREAAQRKTKLKDLVRRPGEDDSPEADAQFIKSFVKYGGVAQRDDTQAGLSSDAPPSATEVDLSVPPEAYEHFPKRKGTVVRSHLSKGRRAEGESRSGVWGR